MPRSQPKGKGFNFGAFEDVVLKELIPLIDSTYRTLADREHRAIAGLSMGAAQAMQIGMTHLDTFSAVGAFSGAGKVDPKTAYGGVFADAGAFDKKVRLLYLHSGTVGLDAGIHKGAKALHEIASAGRQQDRGLPRSRGAGARVADLALCPPRLRPAVVPREEMTVRVRGCRAGAGPAVAVPAYRHDYRIRRIGPWPARLAPPKDLC